MKKIIVSGYGNVAREFIKLIGEKRNFVSESYAIDLVVSGVIGSRTFIYDKDGIDINLLLSCSNGSKGLMEYREKKEVTYDNKSIINGDVLIESTPTNINTGQPGLDIILWAIEKNMDIVSISKGALVTNFKKIKDSISMRGLNLKYSGATAAALPTIDIGEYSLAGCEINKIEGVLNGTTNYILSKMYSDNISFDKALDDARSKGIAEANSTLDITGMDSGCKILLLCNSLLDTKLSLKDVAIKGIEDITENDIKIAKEKNGKIKLMAKALKVDDSYKVEVKPEVIYDNHLLYGVNGTNKGIVFYTDDMGEIAALGGASSPRGAASAALKDVINTYNRKK